MTSFDLTSSKNKVDWNVLPLNPDLYWILDTEKEFFKAHTGIQDDEELKQHVLDIQSLAYSIVPYPFIRLFSFLRLNAVRCPAYEQALMLGKNRTGAILLDVGAGLGTDTRKLIADGYPIENVVANDLNEGLWNVGHGLFKSSPKTYPVAFIAGEILQLTDGIQEAPTVERPALASLSSLVSLKGQVSVMYAAHFFHLFSEQRCRDIAGRLALLLSHEPGSIIFGLNVGAPEAGIHTTPTGSMFCHSAATWKAMWRKCFAPAAVKVEAEVVRGFQKMANAYAGSAEETPKVWLLKWSVERL
ncbi:hypothetical protein JB92DRAFT_3081360 [Gautieria morchelliformis]|nr:hypothetical protein JB92DRAFT_3081360 [Gautieria morchelliformis]